MNDKIYEMLSAQCGTPHTHPRTETVVIGGWTITVTEPEYDLTRKWGLTDVRVEITESVEGRVGINRLDLRSEL